jgi:SP family facilitated glucose transporter-like MFS transporter 1
LTGLALPSKHDLTDGKEEDYDNDVAWRVILGVPIIICLIRIIGVLTVFRFDAPTEELKDH